MTQQTARSLRILIAGCIMTCTCRAADPGTEGSRDTKRAETATEQSFNVLRDPFWPIGYTPQAEAAEEEEMEEEPEEIVDTAALKFDEAVKQLNVRGIMQLGGEYTAMVNDQVVRKGDLVSLVIGGHRYRWRVRSIAQRGVRFEPYDSSAGGSQPAPNRAKIERVVK